MGQMTRDEALSVLTRDNPKVKAADLVMYADAFVEYQAAQKNIGEHGSIVFHPRTGSPIDNPYVRARDRAGALMRRMKIVKADAIWREI